VGNVKEQLMMTWLTAGRVGHVLQLKRENITLKADTMAVQFRRGKGVELGSPYTVHTACPSEWKPTIEAMLNRRSPGQFLWHADSPKARALMGKAVVKARQARAAFEAAKVEGPRGRGRQGERAIHLRRKMDHG
jgi:hypothetical protein